MAEIARQKGPLQTTEALASLPWLAREGPLGFVLSAVSGFVDTSGFILLDGLFTAHVTGNFVLAGAAIAGSSDTGILGRLAMFPIFMIGVMLASLVAGVLRSLGRSVVSGLLCCEATLLCVFLLAGMVLRPETKPSSDFAAVVVVGGTGVLAMAIQNALMREALPSALPTTVMTGNFTQFTMDLLVLLRSRAPAGAEAWRQSAARLRRLTPVLSGFLVGCALGAVSAAQTGFLGTALPITLTALLAAASRQPARP